MKERFVSDYLVHRNGEFSVPTTKTLRKFLLAERHRVIDLKITDYGVFIYTNPSKWHGPDGSGVFFGRTETAAVKVFNETVMKKKRKRYAR